MKTSASLLLATGLLAACSTDDAQPQPAVQAPPAQAATLNMAFDFYPTAVSPARTQSLSLLPQKPVGQQLSDRLLIKLDYANAVGVVEDQLQFTVPLSRQKAGLLGTYTLASQPDASLGEVLVSYIRPTSFNSNTYYNMYDSNRCRLDGSLVISAYDAGRRLISGTYSVRAVNVKTPFTFLSYGAPGDSRPDGDLRLTGVFQELPML